MPADDPRLSQPRTAASRHRILAFALLTVFLIALVIVYALVRRASRDERSVASGTPRPADATAIAEIRRRPHLLFRSTLLGPSYGLIAIVPLDAPSSERVITPLACDRVYATAERGLCLTASRRVFTTYRAIGFDASFAVRTTFKLEGAPSRTRVAPRGPLAVATVFVSGDSYAAQSFSTRTSLFDLATGATLGDLEQFSVTMNGQPFKEQDFNFWGVTFADDGDRFFATLGSKGRLYLVDGRASTRSMQVAAEGVECPSISPDGTRLVFKARMIEAGRLVWRLRVLDLATREQTQLAETRSVDDQAEWLDSTRVLYSLSRATAGSGSSDVWSANADGTGTPQLFVADAFSPSVVR